MPIFEKEAAQPAIKRLDLLDKIWGRVKEDEHENTIIESLMRLSLSVTGALACSLLLHDENRQELYFRYADEHIKQKIRQLHVARRSVIAGWILKQGKPVLVNNAEKNANYYKRLDNATGFKTRSIIGVPLVVEGKPIGVIELMNKGKGTRFTQEDLDMVADLASATALTIQSCRQNAQLLHSYQSTVRAFVALADTKETSGGGHSRRVAEYVMMAVNQLSFTEEAKRIIEYAAILHDIGKLSISDEILNKSGDLTESEWNIIRKHSVIGYNMLRDIPFLKEAARLILYHHERYDGSGYPQGLHGAKIPLGARLIAVADAFDAMTTSHSHRPAFEHNKAFSELKKNMRSQFCPVAVNSFIAGFAKARLKKIKCPYIPDAAEVLTALPSATEKVFKPSRI
jgi:putative nucleotidyltransferase with HDIG domain